MTAIHRQALVPYTNDEMYGLICDIEAYPEFLPWCEGARILEQHGNELSARLELAKGRIRQAFTTRNLMHEGHSIEMALIEGPFKHLKGRWLLEGLGDHGCEIQLQMDFEFANRLMEMTLGRVFNQIVNSLVDSFHQRAVQVYGRR